MAIVAPEFWPKMPRTVSFVLAGAGLSWLGFSGILWLQEFTHMKVGGWPLVAIIAGLALAGFGILWHIDSSRKPAHESPGKGKGDAALHSIDTAPRPLPVATSEIKSNPDWHRISGLEMEASVNGEKKTIDKPMFTIRDFYIKNISTDESVTLNIFLDMEFQQFKYRMDNTGRDNFGRILGKHDLPSVSMPKQNLEPPRYVLSPLTLKPQETAFGSLAFMIRHEPDEELIMIAAAKNEATYKLTLTDAISGKSATIQLPGRYGSQ